MIVRMGHPCAWDTFLLFMQHATLIETKINSAIFFFKYQIYIYLTRTNASSLNSCERKNKYVLKTFFLEMAVLLCMLWTSINRKYPMDMFKLITMLRIVYGIKTECFIKCYRICNLFCFCHAQIFCCRS